MVMDPAETQPSFKDYYQILRLHPDAEAVIVDQVYWHLARLYNTAIPGDASFREKLEELNEAYRVLRSSELRRQYNQRRDAILGKGALPRLPELESDPPPLTVMETQHAQPREEPHPKPLWPARLGLPRLWQSLARGLTALPALSALRVPTMRAPRLPERLASTSVDPDALHRATEAMRARLRAESEELSKLSSAESTHPEERAEDPPYLDTHHQATEAILARLRAESEKLSKLSSAESTHPEERAVDPPDFKTNLNT